MPSQIDTLLRLVPDSPQHVLTFLSSNPTLASSSDTSGYSLLHAASSYSQLELLRTLVQTYNVDVNIRDDEGETPLFAAETLETARCLVEELGADIGVVNGEGVGVVENAKANLEDGSGWAEVAAYLESKIQLQSPQHNGIAQDGGVSLTGGVGGEGEEMRAPPPLPPNVKINVGTMQEVPMDGEDAPDPEIRRRIEELAAREDYQSEEAQAELRELVRQVVGDMGGVNGGGEEGKRRRVD